MNNRIKTGGRQAGTPNKITAALRDTILQALDDAGGVGYLRDQAHANPIAFLTLLGKVLPLKIAGESEERLTLCEIITGVPRAQSDTLTPTAGG